jgi:predicted RNA-binding Zn ribbon-like protein
LPDEFQLVAGHRALDFANTLDNRYDPIRRVELLSSYQRFLDFAQQSGAVTPLQTRRLRGEVDPSGAEKALAQIVEAREAMHFVFLSVAAGEAPPRDSIDTLNRYLAEARAQQKLVWGQGRFEWRSPPPVQSLLSPLHPILLDAADLLASPDLRYVRECSAETCRWLFLDRSKNHSRRWCDMQICGNRAKAQRFHSRQS